MARRFGLFKPLGESTSIVPPGSSSCDSHPRSPMAGRDSYPPPYNGQHPPYPPVSPPMPHTCCTLFLLLPAVSVGPEVSCTRLHLVVVVSPGTVRPISPQPLGTSPSSSLPVGTAPCAWLPQFLLPIWSIFEYFRRRLSPDFLLPERLALTGQYIGSSQYLPA